jgi:hypothetical protein
VVIRNLVVRSPVEGTAEGTAEGTVEGTAEGIAGTSSFGRNGI